METCPEEDFSLDQELYDWSQSRALESEATEPMPEKLVACTRVLASMADTEVPDKQGDLGSADIPLHLELCRDAAFLAGGTGIGYLERKLGIEP